MIKLLFLLFLFLPSCAYATCTNTVGKVPVVAGNNPTQICDSAISSVSGNVGIGTTSPQGPLDVKVATDAHLVATFGGDTLDLLARNDANNAYAPLQFDADAMYINTNSNGTVVLGTGDIYTNAWADYSASSTIVGFSSISSKAIYTKKVGKTVFVSFQLSGTSNATGITFTLPYQNNTPAVYASIGSAYTNGAYTTGCAVMIIGGFTVYIYPTAAQGNWTNGTSAAYGQLWYQSA